MKKYTLLPLFLAAFVLVGAGCFGLETNTVTDMTSDQGEPTGNEDTGTEQDEMIENDEMGEEMENEEMMDEEQSDEISTGTYEAYSESKLAMANSGNVVLFFKASWCPSCRALDADIKDSLSDIPADLTILEVDYDEATELKRKYGVTTQHTLVQVDADGNELKQWSGGGTLESITEEIE